MKRISYLAYGDTDTLIHLVLRFTLHERRFTRKRSGLAIAAEALMNNAG